ncbi:MAG: hypothetical protein AAF598_17960 [Bacteroidota bacterium]
MKAFVSYAIDDQDEFVPTYIAEQLRTENFAVTSSYYEYRGKLKTETKQGIRAAHLYIGLITANGMEKNRVLHEYNFATKENIPALLLSEDTIKIDPAIAKQGNVVFFNRHQPERAESIIQRKLTDHGKDQKASKQDTYAWMLGGRVMRSVLNFLVKIGSHPRF